MKRSPGIKSGATASKESSQNTLLKNKTELLLIIYQCISCRYWNNKGSLCHEIVKYTVNSHMTRAVYFLFAPREEDGRKKAKEDLDSCW